MGKRTRLVILILMLVLLVVLLGALTLRRLQADPAVTVTRPDYPVIINEQPWNPEADLPLLTYQGVTYFPVSYADRLGLTVTREGSALSITVNGTPAGALAAEDAVSRLPKSAAVVPDGPISVAHESYDSSTADAPFLYQLGETYMPLTESLCTALCLDYAQADGGLTVTTTGRLRAPTDALPHFILHAGGATADGTVSTNSIEAADRSYAEGYRWLEIDFSWTKDDALVCVHDWGTWKKQLGIKVKTPPTLKRFQEIVAEQADVHAFTPETLNSWLKEHPDVMIVTDVKEDNVRAMTWLSEAYPELRDRLIVQIYALDEYEPIRELGYKNIILTMYRIPWEEYHDLDTLCAFIRDSRILAITMAADENVRDVFEALVATGIPVYVHTLDAPEEQIRWLTDGAYGIYTNYGDTRAESEERFLP